MERAVPGTLERLKKLGAPDISACYSCGHCSAVCPLTGEGSSFPRRLIRFALLGLERRILASPETWLCYGCGECSDTCPRQADPSALMAALRRLAIRRFSLGRLADRIPAGLAWSLLTAAAAAFVLLFRQPAPNMARVEFLSFVGLEELHIAGIAVVAFILTALGVNVFMMVRALRSFPAGSGLAGAPPFSWKRARSAVWPALGEAAGQSRFGKCDDNRPRRLAHLAVSYGFAGMFLATVIIGAVDFKILPAPRWVSLALGSASGAVFLAGLSYYFYLRIRRHTAYGKRTLASDWSLLLLLALSVLSGFVMVGLRFLALPGPAYFAFAVHLVAVFVFLVSLPFSKFAHFLYRPLALWLAGAAVEKKSP